MPEREPTRSAWILLAMLNKHYHMYEGTVPYAVKARRRARNKTARLSRRTNRGR